MEYVIWTFIVLIGLSVLGGVIHFIAFILQTRESLRQANNAYRHQTFPMSAGTNLDSSFTAQLSELENMMKRYNGGQLNQTQLNEMNLLMMQTENQYHDMNALSQQKFDTQVSSMAGYAASNGLDWNPYQ